ncbi:MAG: hypothetical protein N2738_05520, partial [Thermodesulfovibrionales bacterium]|nr:hypothetical protein [Thermodesulfovibrionales bacterium]
MEYKNINLSKVVLFIGIFIVLSFSVFLKLKDIKNFSDPDNFFTNHDSFRYARYAVEIQNKTYNKIDYLADVPDLAVNQYPPPLLSQIAVWLSNLSG